jgi:hypothetical protein
MHPSSARTSLRTPLSAQRSIRCIANGALLLCAISLSACGKDSSSQPPIQGGGAVTLAVRAGDGQEAAPGAAVAAAPVVLATNASGQPQAGVVITFAVDSGAGTLAATQVTTASDGTASPGRWTLGAAEGANVLRVTAAGANTLRIRATASIPTTLLLNNVTVPRSGGTLTVSAAGNPLNGMTLAIPDTAFSAPAIISIGTKSIAPPTLPTGYAQVGPALVITNSEAVATRPMVMTIPVSVQSPDTALGAFFVDQATGTLEPVPVAARTANTLTIFSRHFTADRLLKPASTQRNTRKEPGAEPALAMTGFSPVIIIIISVPAAQLNVATTTGFQPGRDDWEFVNYGSILGPGGICAGMSISAMYYFYALRSGGTLNGRYNPVASGAYRSFTNNGGLRLASVVQQDYSDPALAAWENTVNAFAILTTIPRARLYYQSLVMAMQVTKMPQLLTIFGVNIGHAVVAYGSANGVVSFADPNEPGNSRSMTFANNAFTPFPFQSKGGQPSAVITRVVPVGASALIDGATLASLWAKVPDESVGRTRFPTTTLERYDAFADKFVDLDTSATVFVSSLEQLAVRTKCPTTCPRTYAPNSLINTKVITEAGALLYDDSIRDDAITLTGSAQRFGIIEFIPSGNPNTANDWSRFRWITAKYQPVLLEPVRPQIRVDSLLRLTATAAPEITQQVAKYTWTFNDGSPAVNTTVPNTSHKYTKTGDFKALVVLFDSRNAILGRDSTVVSVGTLPLVGWSLRTATVQSSTLPAGGIGLLRSDTVAFNFATAVISRLTGNPSNTSIFVGGVAVAGPACDAGAILQQALPGAPTADSLVSAQFVGLLGTCGDPDFTGTMIMGPLGNGTVVGTAAAVPNPNLIVVPGGSINATMSARNLAGTFVWNVRYSSGIAKYTVVFTGVQVRPR